MAEPENPKIPVLDHGFVRLIDHMGSDLSIVRAARVSHDAAWRAGANSKSDERLIGFLWKNRHTTPFEAVTMTVEVAAPIFVFRQWHRHRTWSINELSARYRELPETFYVPEPALVGRQSKSNKQGRDTSEDAAQFLQDRTAQCSAVRTQNESAFALYRKLLAEDWPRELARTVLPLGTYSHQFGTVNLLNLFRFLDLREDAHAQHEIRVYAEQLVELARTFAPVAVAAWEASRPVHTDVTKTAAACAEHLDPETFAALAPWEQARVQMQTTAILRTLVAQLASAKA